MTNYHFKNALHAQEIHKNEPVTSSRYNDIWNEVRNEFIPPIKDYEKRLATSIMNESNKKLNTTECVSMSAAYYPISTVNHFPSDNFYNKILDSSYDSTAKLLSNFEATSNFCVSGTLQNINYAYQSLPLEKDTSPKRVYKNFDIDDFKYSDVAKRNIKAIFEKRKIKNKEDCVTIIENLSPEGVETFVKKYVKREIKCSILKMLRKLEASDPIVVT